MYSKYRTKEGDLGPRGFDGYPGKQGDDGECNQTRCRKDLLLLMVIKKIEDKINKKLTNDEIRDIENNIEFDKINLENMTYNHVDKFNDEITYKIEIHDEPLNEIKNNTININEILNEIIENK